MPRILLAEDDDAVRNMLQAALERDGFEVAAVANVRDALRCIATENFDALLSDLHMPHAGDGFTVVSAMRHTHPQAVTLVLSGYPAIDEALSAIRLQADEVLMKPIQIATLREAIRKNLANPLELWLAQAFDLHRHFPSPRVDEASCIKLRRKMPSNRRPSLRRGNHHNSGRLIEPRVGTGEGA